MKFTLIGTGIAFDLTELGMEELKKCDEIYIEAYTLPMEKEKIAELEKRLDKKINLLERESIESDFLVKRAKEKRIALLCGGDPLTATTHSALLIDMKKAKIETLVIHNSSIFVAAAGKCGLQIYKFGKTASIATPREKYKPDSWFNLIKENLERGAHTLVLLDTQPEPMEAKLGLELIKKTDTEEFLTNKSIAVLSRIGEKDEKINYGKIEELLTKVDQLGKSPFAIIVPGKLHFLEEEFLESL
ncbi:MAG: diphthine synthase [Candidatus Micrarchaeota archaeon]